MTILEKFVAANAILNTKKTVNIQATVKAKKDIDYAVKLLLKGYCLDDDMKRLMIKYGHILKVPDAKVHAGENITNNRMKELLELVYPKVPHGYLVALIVQKFGDKVVNYISNGERNDMIISLRTLADNLEKGMNVEMPSEN